MWWAFSILRDQPSHTTLLMIGFRLDTRMETDALPMSPTSIKNIYGRERCEKRVDSQNYGPK